MHKIDILLVIVILNIFDILDIFDICFIFSIFDICFISDIFDVFYIYFIFRIYCVLYIFSPLCLAEHQLLPATANMMTTTTRSPPLPLRRFQLECSPDFLSSFLRSH